MCYYVGYDVGGKWYFAPLMSLEELSGDNRLLCDRIWKGMNILHDGKRSQASR